MARDSGASASEKSVRDGCFVGVRVEPMRVSADEVIAVRRARGENCARETRKRVGAVVFE